MDARARADSALRISCIARNKKTRGGRAINGATSGGSPIKEHHRRTALDPLVTILGSWEGRGEGARM